VSNSSPTASAANKARTRAWIISGAIAVVVIIVIVIAVSLNGSKPGPTPSPTGPATVTPTASPTATPTATPTVTPTASPTPTPTPTPTNSKSPAPSPTTSPAPSPTIAPAVAWANATYGTFSTLVTNGNGNAHVALPSGATGAIITLTNNGPDAGAFVAQMKNQFGNDMGAPLVNTTGDYVGTVAYGLTAQVGSTPRTLLITSTGSWTIEISSVSSASTTIGAGTGDQVFLYGGATSTLHVQYSLLGGAQFSVSEYAGTSPMQLSLVNTNSSYDDTVALPAGPAVLVVNSYGSWNLSVG
jgi:hypothetical protein